MAKKRDGQEDVAIALLDAMAAGPVLPTGGVDRAAIESAPSVASISNNFAVQRYLRDHPDEVLGESRLHAIEEGRRLWAVDGVAWLIERGHLRVVDGGGLAMGKPFPGYEPGTHREDELFRVRRTSPGRIALLRESIERLPGLKEYFPILLDVDGNVVDGRHRREIDPNWPVARTRVPRDTRIAVALAANRSNAWTQAEWDDLRVRAEYVYGKARAGRELARLALLENPKRSNPQIGRLVGCSKDTVRRAREELEQTGALRRFRDQGGSPRSDGTPAQPRTPKAKKVADDLGELIGGGSDDSAPAQEQVPPAPPVPPTAPPVVYVKTGGTGADQPVRPKSAPEPESTPEELVIRLILGGTRQQVGRQLQEMDDEAFRVLREAVDGEARRREQRIEGRA